MSKRDLFLAITAWIAASVAFGQTSYVFQVPGQNGSTTQVTGLGDNDFSRNVTTSSAAIGTFRVLALPDASKFYLISATGVQTAAPNLTAVANVPGKGEGRLAGCRVSLPRGI